MDLYYVMMYSEGGYFESLERLRKRLIEIHKVPTSGSILMGHDLAVEYAKELSIKHKGNAVVFKLDLENSTLIVPTIKADEVKLE